MRGAGRLLLEDDAGATGKLGCNAYQTKWGDVDNARYVSDFLTDKKLQSSDTYECLGIPCVSDLALEHLSKTAASEIS